MTGLVEPWPHAAYVALARAAFDYLTEDCGVDESGARIGTVADCIATPLFPGEPAVQWEDVSVFFEDIVGEGIADQAKAFVLQELACDAVGEGLDPDDRDFLEAILAGDRKKLAARCPEIAAAFNIEGVNP